MKTSSLVIILSVASLATINVFAGEAFLSPRAADNQPKVVSGVNNDPDVVAMARSYPGSPRLQDNQIRFASGQTPESYALVYERHMAGTPRMIGESAEHPGSETYSGSSTVAQAY